MILYCAGIVPVFFLLPIYKEVLFLKEDQQVAHYSVKHT